MGVSFSQVYRCLSTYICIRIGISMARYWGLEKSFRVCDLGLGVWGLRLRI